MVVLYFFLLWVSSMTTENIINLNPSNPDELQNKGELFRLVAESGGQVPIHNRRLLSATLKNFHFSMVNENHRSFIYENAIRRAVQLANEQLGRPPIVLDIGTGTGLLSMMAARSGPCKVYALESNKPLAEAARRIIELNGLSKQITVYDIMSTQLRVGKGRNKIPERADILVSEIIDSLIVGEDMLPTYDHALKNLLKPSAIIIPHKAVVYGALVSSPVLAPRGYVNSKGTNGFNFSIFNELRYPDYEMVNMKNKEIELLTDPFTVFSFDFAYSLVGTRWRVESPKVVKPGTIIGMLTWFDFWVDDTPESLITTRFDTNDYKFMFHWTQGIRYSSNPINVKTGDTCHLLLVQTDRNIFFHLNKKRNELSSLDLLKDPLQRSTPFVTISAYQRMSEKNLNSAYYEAIKAKAKSTITMTVSSQGSPLLPLMAAKAGAKDILVFEEEPLLVNVSNVIIKANKGKKIKVTSGPRDWTEIASQYLRQKKVKSFGLVASYLFHQQISHTNCLMRQLLGFWHYTTIGLDYQLFTDRTSFIPSMAQFQIRLISSEQLYRRLNYVDFAAGFDVRLMNLFASVDPVCEDTSSLEDFVYFSEEVTGLTIDFSTSRQPSTESLDLFASQDGKIHGVEIKNKIWLSNEPEIMMPDTNETWTAIQFFPSPLDVKSGERISVQAIFDGFMNFNVQLSDHVVIDNELDTDSL